jgi:hypothetical protein
VGIDRPRVTEDLALVDFADSPTPEFKPSVGVSLVPQSSMQVHWCPN